MAFSLKPTTNQIWCKYILTSLFYLTWLLYFRGIIEILKFKCNPSPLIVFQSLTSEEDLKVNGPPVRVHDERHLKYNTVQDVKCNDAICRFYLCVCKMCICLCLQELWGPSFGVWDLKHCSKDDEWLSNKNCPTKKTHVMHELQGSSSRLYFLSNTILFQMLI